LRVALWLTLSPIFALPLWSQVPEIGAVAPEFTLEQLAGGEASLSDFKGHPLIVNFWATWCKPCRTEIPLLISAYRSHQDVGLEILAVNLSDQERMKDVPIFSAELGLPFPVLLDRKGSVRRLYRLRGVPTTIFIDSAGVVQMINQGPVNTAALERGLAEILPGR
jgi:thiol-disulfide isomerase/thioredoxin